MTVTSTRRDGDHDAIQNEVKGIYARSTAAKAARPATLMEPVKLFAAPLKGAMGDVVGWEAAPVPEMVPYEVGIAAAVEEAAALDGVTVTVW